MKEGSGGGSVGESEGDVEKGDKDDVEKGDSEGDVLGDGGWGWVLVWIFWGWVWSWGGGGGGVGSGFCFVLLGVGVSMGWGGELVLCCFEGLSFERCSESGSFFRLSATAIPTTQQTHINTRLLTFGVTSFACCEGSQSARF